MAHTEERHPKAPASPPANTYVTRRCDAVVTPDVNEFLRNSMKAVRRINKVVAPASSQTRRDLDAINGRIAAIMSANDDTFQEDPAYIQEEYGILQDAVTSVIADLKKASLARKGVLAAVDHGLALLIDELRKEEEGDLTAREDRVSAGDDSEISEQGYTEVIAEIRTNQAKLRSLHDTEVAMMQKYVQSMAAPLAMAEQMAQELERQKGLLATQLEKAEREKGRLKDTVEGLERDKVEMAEEQRRRDAMQTLHRQMQVSQMRKLKDEAALAQSKLAALEANKAELADRIAGAAAQQETALKGKDERIEELERMLSESEEREQQMASMRAELAQLDEMREKINQMKSARAETEHTALQMQDMYEQKMLDAKAEQRKDREEFEAREVELQLALDAETKLRKLRESEVEDLKQEVEATEMKWEVYMKEATIKLKQRELRVTALEEELKDSRQVRDARQSGAGRDSHRVGFVSFVGFSSCFGCGPSRAHPHVRAPVPSPST